MASLAPPADTLPTAPAPYSPAELEQFGLCAERMPQHIAIIMDGNGRWAQAQGLPRIEGHQRGVLVVRDIVEECSRLGVKQLTLYCFSSENWKRPELELKLLMELLERYLIDERPEILRQNLQFSVIGRREGLGEGVLREMQRTTDLSRGNTGMRLCLAVNYGSRCELVDAARALAEDVKQGRLNPEEITEEALADRLYTAGMPDPDLVIRTAGELRVSNFLLWQISYAELWVTSLCWPDFDREVLLSALRDFGSRNRRFGGLSS
ncbi:isoprenyl transferase [Planctellipticum variicoloris]|uniref:isoprenyl transferase n=1 Tax=Planctellipticum variicoloris TaxID=3064265 RepID=UPI003013CB15|nr:isoprenyl transferase [Planctomycetaceae bacterium SH412]